MEAATRKITFQVAADSSPLPRARAAIGHAIVAPIRPAMKSHLLMLCGI
jgi:hypothetical protein